VNPPELAPMLATTAALPPTFDGWIIEPKWDGVRAIVTVHDGSVSIASRLGNDVTGGYPELAALAAGLAGRSAVLDGEIVAFDERTGRPSFQRLQRRMHVRSPSAQLRRDVPVQLLVFDVLWLEGELVTERPQSARREVLEGLGLDGPCWHTSPLVPPAPAEDLLAACRQTGMEGYVAYPSSRGGHRPRRHRVGQWTIRALRVGSPYVGQSWTSFSWTSQQQPVRARRPAWPAGQRPARRLHGSGSRTVGRSCWTATEAMTTG
jgi:bifunctional non-homologous end joining protein LigD